MNESRTKKSLKNAQVALVFYFIQLILGFFSRKAFFDYLGSEILGLNTTASNILGFLNIAELGISNAISYFLYQPLFEQNYDKLNKLVTIQGWIYRKIAFFIIIASIILMCFFPWIFSKSHLSIWYAFLTYGVLLFCSLLGYFRNYRLIVLYADQKGYKIQKYTQSISTLKTILQIFTISFLPYPFFSWLILELLGAIITTIILNIIIKKEYPRLIVNISDGRKYLNYYPDILKKTKQIFFHRIGSVILSQSSPLIIYGFTNLSIVALYGNYLLIVNKICSLLNSVFSSTGAAIGNLVASKDSLRIVKVFWELYDSRLYISFVTLLCLYYLTNPFITIWIGEDYCLSKTFLLLFIILNSISTTRSTVDSYLNAYGLYKDIWAPLVEAGLNVSLSILLGFYYGLNGIIVGILISQVVIICLWKPYFLFKFGLQMHVKKYFLPVLYRYCIIVVLSILSKYAYEPLQLHNISNIKEFIIDTSIIGSSSTLVGGITFFILFSGTKDFVIRIKNLVLKKYY